ncbi:gluconate 2-dehydrogenase subunit 3 family protein [Halorussus limi]|uniref:Gluconate 2-dehydrogenase subunit 3 family protein n=1 Tax=Halorussus limi TaxID=2938695 RepID=A0A8U0HU22_9EURY|nr:gluconate 2-dehydrogenase subunit 3 family protein [Halorussus limi]UPV74206.1 gluconate 2-dehydrogenase subunit 3 family protein [Halorussus limi]
MELTRRDALVALAGGGAAVGTGAVLSGEFADATPFADDPAPEDRLDTLLAVAEVVYPSEVSGVEEFVRTYALGRVSDRPDYREGMVDALATLDEYARSWFDDDFRRLDAGAREKLLDQMGVDTASPSPEGADPDRVRYYLVNELLYALYTSPTGGKLVGIENPQGHPGGTGSYRRGPNGGGGTE